MCRWCGDVHDVPLCPIVKAFEFDETGAVRRVEYLTQADFDPVIKEMPPADQPDSYPTLGGQREKK